MHSPIFLILAIFGVFVLLAIIWALLKASEKPRANGKGMEASAYELVPAFLSPAERSFFGVLQQAVSADFQIFAKVRLADIVRPVKNPSRSGWQTAFNRIAGKHVDFVLCDLARLNVLAVVELDDSTHGRFERGVRDSLVDSALADAKIPVLRVPARQSYAPTQIREQVMNLLHSAIDTTGTAGKLGN